MTPGAEHGRPGAEPLHTLVRSIAESVPAAVDVLVAGRSRRLHREVLTLLERPLIAHVLARTGGNQRRAAQVLGLNRNTLRKRCRELGLALPRASRDGGML